MTAKSTKTTDILQTAVAIRCNGPARDLSTTEHRVTFLRLSIKRQHRGTLLIAPPGDVESDMPSPDPKVRHHLTCR